MSAFITAQSAALQKQQLLQRTQILKKDQIVYGSVSKRLPNQMAEVKIGNQTVIAKLTSPLPEGSKQWLQVVLTPEGMELKAVADPMEKATTGKMITQLLDSLGVKPTPELRQLMTEAVRQNWPISKDGIGKIASWLKNDPVPETAAVIRTMLARELPLTDRFFDSIRAGSQSLDTTLSMELKTLLTQLNASAPAPAIKSAQQAIEGLQEPFQRAVADQSVARAIQMLSDGTTADKQAALTFLKQAGLVAQEAGIADWGGHLTVKTKPATALQQAIVSLQTGTPQAIGELQQLTERLLPVVQGHPAAIVKQLAAALQNPSDLPAIVQHVKSLMEASPSLTPRLAPLLEALTQPEARLPAQMLHQLAATLPPDRKEAVMALAQQITGNPAADAKVIPQVMAAVQGTDSDLAPAVKGMTALTAEEAVRLSAQPFTAQTEAALSQQLTGKTIEPILRQLVEMMGSNFEAKLGQNPQTAAESVKAHLIALLQDPAFTGAARETAERMLNKMNGQQLLSVENGPQQQLIMQFPLTLFQQQQDVTMQWTGRRKDDGTIDADHAKILFYMNLESLKETIVDMSVQNRVISLDIYNESAVLETMAGSLIPVMKDALSGKGYKLSSVQFYSTKETEPPIQSFLTHSTTPYAGVDIRV